MLNNNKITQLQEILEAVNLEEAHTERALQNKKELLEILQYDSTFQNVDPDEMKCICTIDDIYSRAWLVKYKGLGYILHHNLGDGRFRYIATVEEFLSLLESKDFDLTI